MSGRVRLLRQQIDDFNKRSAAADDTYATAFANYEGQVDAYNAQIEAYNAGTAQLEPGDAWENEEGRLLYINESGKQRGYAPDEATKQPDGTWTTTYIGNVIVPQGTEGAVQNESSGAWELLDQPITREIYVKATHPGTANTPTPPDQEEVKVPSFTLKQQQELVNPSRTPAQAELLKGHGIMAKSQLADNSDPSKNSAFRNLMGDDPNNLKDSGILARTIAGQL